MHGGGSIGVISTAVVNGAAGGRGFATTAGGGGDDVGRCGRQLRRHDRLGRRSARGAATAAASAGTGAGTCRRRRAAVTVVGKGAGSRRQHALAVVAYQRQHEAWADRQAGHRLGRGDAAATPALVGHAHRAQDGIGAKDAGPRCGGGQTASDDDDQRDQRRRRRMAKPRQRQDATQTSPNPPRARAAGSEPVHCAQHPMQTNRPTSVGTD